MPFGSCTGQDHCGNAFTCARCARERQRRIADKAEALERQYGQLAMTVIKPELNTQDEIRRLRASFLRRCLTPAGIWTVETGTQFARLHINILSPKPIPARWKNCETYSELLIATARDAAAYISKRSGMPAIEQYQGRLYGTFGQIGEILVNQRAAPVVAAASIEVALAGTAKNQPGTISAPSTDYRTPEEEKEGWREGAQVNGKRVWFSMTNPMKYTWKPPRPELTLEERQNIMRKHLPNIYAAVGKQT